MIFNSHDEIILQGATGAEGSRMLAWMKQAGARVVAGVTPGKGGQEIFGTPIFNSVSDARIQFPRATISCTVVPPLAALGAVQEALAAGITFIHLLTDLVPVRDCILIRTAARTHGAFILGPGSIGVISSGVRIGYLGGEHPFENLTTGDVALISSSGGMLNELLHACVAEKIGIHSAWGVGGALVPATSIAEMVARLDTEPEIKTIGIFIEHGNPFLFTPTMYNKKIVLLIAGHSMALLPKGIAYGHAGALLDDGVADIASLEKYGMVCTQTVEEFVKHL